VELSADGTPLGDELTGGTTQPAGDGELLQIQGLPNGASVKAQTNEPQSEWRKASGYDYLRTVAVARLLLDNIPHHQASWVTQGPKIAQIGLNFGLDDFGSTMMEENVVSAAGTDFVMPISEIERLIREAGYEPRRRNTLYEMQ
jgi:cyclic dehypoxanthinyl futalosine synthase